ncbi:hypothetical protein [Amniculibacterium sp. G2-70]|uniref:hypothetical protein n=1 Tax=Amniculibacterium sp. G2-70 TaxID=2767188 RepID=UPI0016547CD2|nr:hypothetical protein [Amniculibacterium sp. G2-70]
MKFENTGAPQLFGSTEVGQFFEYSALKSAYPNFPVPTGLHIGNYGDNISGILKGFVRQNFTTLSTIFSK